MKEIKLANSGETFLLTLKLLKKSILPDGFSGEITKLVGEAMTHYLAILLEIFLNNATLPCDWKETTVVPITQRGRSISSLKL